MGILIGMDEAGYGPNFGPLVVAATAWHVKEAAKTPPPELQAGEPASAGGNGRAPVGLLNPQSKIRNPKSEPDLYRLLRTIVARSASERQVAIADSKSLYHPGQGLRQLERGVHTVLQLLGQPVDCWSTLVGQCAADPNDHHSRVCWPDGHNSPLPIDATDDEITKLSTRLTRACDAANVHPILIRARLVFPAEFNDLVAHHGTKGAALSHITVALFREVIDAVSPPAPISAVCDKHGGRNFYTSLLQHHFSEHWVEPVHESAAESRYEWGPPESRVRVAFRTKGERFLPTALASMTAKYLRELSMKAFNAFWSAHVPNLRPTAGYPADARRFRQDIATAQHKLRINDHHLWRNR